MGPRAARKNVEKTLADGNGARAQQYSFWNVHFSLSPSLPLVISVS